MSSPSINEKQQVFILALKHYGIFEDRETYKIVCPFHGDKNPSLQITLDKAYFYCFGCGLHGSTYELIKAYNPSWTALEIYQFMSKLKKGIKSKKQRIYSIYSIYSNTTTYIEYINIARDYYYNLPDINWYNPVEDAKEVKHYMINRGFSSKSLNKYGAKYTCSYNYQIVFPLLENGKFRGYVMRANDPEVEANRKYFYNKGFKRRKCLAGVYTKEKPLLLVEGYLDCLAAMQLGVENVCAILGWKLSPEQLQKIKRNKIGTIVCGLDNDEAGRKGYEYLKKLAPIHGFRVYRVHYPKGIKDFGDLLKNSSASEVVLAQIKKFEKN